MGPFNKKRGTYVFIILLALAVGFLFANNPSSAKQEESGIEQDRILVKYKAGTSDKEKKYDHRKRNTKQEGSIEDLDIDKVKVNEGEVKKKIKEYEKDPDVEYAEPDHVASAFKVTNDPSLASQWGMYKIQAANATASAWDVTGGSGIKVAVLDTGIEETHSDLSGKVVASTNFSTSSTSNDVNGHGTHVAGVIAANSNNGVGVAGVAYGASLMNVEVLNDSGSGSYSSIINGIIWATDNGAKVISMSLGGSNSSAALQEAIDYAWSHGVVIIASAGNDGTSAINYPAYYSNVIAVASTDQADAKSSFSQYGSWVDVAAPGSSIYSTYVGNTYRSLSGTSMAAPHVAGIAGLVWAKGATSNSQVRALIESSADKISGTGTSWSAGRVNAYAAVGGTITPVPNPGPNPAASGPVAIQSMSFQNKNKKGGQLVWNTNIASTARVYYGTNKKKLKSLVDSSIATNHTINFTTLKPGKTYYFKFNAYGVDGTSAKSQTIKMKLPK